MPETPVVVRFFMNGDETGTIHSMEFPSVKEYMSWLGAMADSVEIFSEKY